MDEIIEKIGIKPYYQEAGGVLYCGDCLEIMKNIPEKSIDLVLTDPPYGLNKKIHDGGTWAKKSKFDDCLKWDFVISNEYWKTLFNISKNQIIWGGNYYQFQPSRCWLVWKKPLFPTMSDAELAWTSFDHNIKVFDESRNPEGYKEHPTQKPLSLMKWCFNLFPENDIIIDIFSGSGTTLVAAKELGRKWIGVEIEPKYCEIAKKRLAQEYLKF